jgi:hypothetical protein
VRAGVIVVCTALISTACHKDSQQRYAIEEFTSASDAAAQRKEIEQALSKATSSAARKPCDAPLQAFTCVEADLPEDLVHGQGWRAQYLQGYLPAFDVHIDPTVNRTISYVEALREDPRFYSFASADEVRDGHATYKAWRDLARAGKPVRCSATDCSLIVNVVAPPGEEALGYCTVAKARSVQGAPENCMQVSISREGALWLLVYRGILLPPGIGGGGADDLTLHLSGRLDMGAIYAALTRALGNQPLGLMVETTSAGDIVGVAHKRRSPILNGYNESVTVRFQPRQKGADLDVTIVTTIFLNPQNTNRNIDYSSPEENQQEAYLKSVLLAIRLSLLGVCPAGTWNGDTDFLCHPDVASGNRGLTRLPAVPTTIDDVGPSTPPKVAPGAQLLRRSVSAQPRNLPK